MAKAPDELKMEKALVAAVAASWVRPGMQLGIGSGSTVALFIEALERRCARESVQFSCVVASTASERLAKAAGLKVVGFDLTRCLDLVVDGADEIDPRLNMIKGGGGALLRERIVASAGAHVLIVGDSSKPVQQLGRFPLPVEIIPFGAELARADLDALGARPTLRTAADGTAPLMTDEGNWIYDCPMGNIPEPDRLAASLATVRAFAAHGLFLHVADAGLIADGDTIFLLQPDGARTRLEQGAPSPFC